MKVGSPVCVYVDENGPSGREKPKKQENKDNLRSTVLVHKGGIGP